MTLVLPLPRSTAALVERVPIPARHPGLQLDKFIRPCPRQEDQKNSLAEVCQTLGDPALFDVLHKRRARCLATLSATVWRSTTTGPLTLHLARASALENAGICLHPLYGFVYLPGTGLKGMARAYAETVWLPAQADSIAAWRQIESVFGWAPSSDRGKTWKPSAVPKHAKGEEANVGAIVFHDAWPAKWPLLTLDIVNNHHRDYYAPPDKRSDYAPGDWEAPSMVSFLAVGRDQTFSFALSPRRADAHAQLGKLAREWLVGALTHHGAGAKTAAGYGNFKLDEPDGVASQETSSAVQAIWSAACEKQACAEFPCTLRLVAPAFLAGANQEPGDCDLRSATLRGLLRWWWRTMHAGFVDLNTLRGLEATVWGNTAAGGAVRLTVVPVSRASPQLYSKPDAAKHHALPPTPNNKTTQGLSYHTFGMDDKKDGRRAQRSFAPPGEEWQAVLTARRSYYPTDVDPTNARPVAPALLIEQAQAALWLLCHFGGVGSKGRKGFGSLDVPQEFDAFDLQRCKDTARRFRHECGLSADMFQPHRAASPALEQMIPAPDISTPWKDPWFALDQMGAAAQRFAQNYKHNLRKKGLGLPRNVRPPLTGKFQPSPHVAKTGRHAAPIYYHLARKDDGTLVIRVTAFPACELPNLNESRALLEELLQHLQSDLQQRTQEYKIKGQTPPASPAAPSPADRPTPNPMSPPAQFKSQQLVDAILVEDPKGKGRRFARHESSGLVGPIQNPEAIPAEQKVGDKVGLVVASISSDNKQIQFRYPTAADDAKGKVPPSGKPGGGPSRGPTPRGGRR